jgi:hypothetical protein
MEETIFSKFLLDTVIYHYTLLKSYIKNTIFLKNTCLKQKIEKKIL